MFPVADRKGGQGMPARLRLPSGDWFKVMRAEHELRLRAAAERRVRQWACAVAACLLLEGVALCWAAREGGWALLFGGPR